MGGILFDGGDTRSPTSTSPSTPSAMHPNPPTSVTSSQEGVRSPVRHTAASNPQAHLQNPHANLQTALSSVMDSFRSPTQNRAQLDQPTSLIQSRIGGRSPSHNASPGAQLTVGQPPIGSHVLHRKSSSMDSGRVPSPSPLNGFAHTAGGNVNAPGRGGKPSPRAQPAQHAAAMPSSDGPIASLLGLNALNGPRAEGNLRTLRPSKSLQYGGSRGNRTAGTNGQNVSSLLPQGMQDLANGSAASVSWMHQPSNTANKTNNGNESAYSGNQGMSHHVDAFQRQLHVSNGGHLNL